MKEEKRIQKERDGGNKLNLLRNEGRREEGNRE